ncbi:hypothetical protein Tco_0603004 [Tanacetum coccineum]
MIKIERKKNKDHCPIFNGINLSSTVNLSHLFYADDAIFIGQWNELNIDTLVRVLECFFRASGLRINMSKSKIMGVNVEDAKVKIAANKLGCLVLKTPFTILVVCGGFYSQKDSLYGQSDKVFIWWRKEFLDKVGAFRGCFDLLDYNRPGRYEGGLLKSCFLLVFIALELRQKIFSVRIMKTISWCRTLDDKTGPGGEYVDKVGQNPVPIKVKERFPHGGMWKYMEGGMSFSKRPDSDAVCYTKPLDSLKHWNDHFFWVDSFACLASFLWHTNKNVSRDLFTNSNQACLMRMIMLSLLLIRLCSGNMDLLAFIQVVDPIKVKVGERLVSATVATLPMVTSSVSATPEHESGVLADSITGLNLRTIGASESLGLPFCLYLLHPYCHFTGDDQVCGYLPCRHCSVGSGNWYQGYLSGSCFYVHEADSNGDSMKVRCRGSPLTPPRHDLSMGSGMLAAEDTQTAPVFVFANGKIRRRWVLHLLFTLFNVIGSARQACLNEKLESDSQISAVEATKESLNGKVVELQSLVSTKDLELKDLNVAVSSLRSQKDGLVDQVHALETICSGLCDQVSGYERLKEQIEEFQDVQMNIVNDKVAKLDADLLEMALHLEEKFYPHLLTIISGRRWLLTHGLKLAIVKCLNYQEYLSSLGAAISRAIEKGMQDGLSAGIDHGKAGRSLMDVVAYNPAAEADYQSNYFESSMRVERIRENVAAKRSARIGVWTPLVDPLSAENLVGEAGTSSSVPATIVTTTAMSITFASASSVPLITIEDYEIVGTDGLENAQGNGQGNVASFSTFEFEKEDLNTTPEPLFHLA